MSLIGSEQARSGPVPGHLRSQDLLFAYKSIYTEINSGILIRGLDPSLSSSQAKPRGLLLGACIWSRIANGPDKQIGPFHNEFLINLALVFFSKLKVPRLLLLYHYIACK